MPSPPKPWERNGAIATQSSPATQMSSSPVTTATAMSSPPVTTSSSSPAVPQRPTSLASSSLASTSTAVAPAYGAPYTPIGTSYTSPYSYGASSYGAASYSSPYNRLGTGGYGGYGSYGGYGGAGGYGGGMYGGYGGAANPYGMPGIDPATGQPSLIQQVGSSTSQTFALIQSIVGTFTGFAQMLDSTFMATHSSFFAMLGVAEQFSQLKMALGQVLGLFGFVGWLRGWWKGDRGQFRDDFKRFIKGENVAGAAPGAPKPSKKPLIVFLVAVFGLPYLMNRLIKHIASRLPPPPPVQFGPDGQPLSPQQVIDPSNLTFARTMYPFETKDPVELSLAKGELVAVLTQTDPATGGESEWWRGRTREGREGWFPRVYVEVVKQKRVDSEPAMSQPPLGKVLE